ncbi:MAG: hypothetical protein QOG69_2522 [Actinomycetota bacterium]|nr:hypothetical protein [Actinomycetota bacterium]
MSRADDLLSNVQKAVGDKPLLLIAGAGDLVSEKLRELPDALSAWQEENRDFPMRAAGTVIGSVFRANLRLGELYDDLTRRGQDVMTKMRGDDVVAEEDEPFVHEPFMPEPVRSVNTSASASTTRKPASATKAAKKVSAAKKAPSSKKSAAAKTAGPTATSRTKSATKKAPGKSAR